jgi:hypothetical protein
MHSYKAVSKRKWQRRSCWRSSFFTHLQTRSPFYFSPSFVRLTYFITDMKLFCGSWLDLVHSDHSPTKLALFLSTKYRDSFPDWKTAETYVWLLTFFTVAVLRKGGAVPLPRTVMNHRMLFSQFQSRGHCFSPIRVCAICAGPRVTALGFTLGLPSGIVDFTRAPCWCIPVAARSKMLVCSRSLAGIAGSNPAGAKNVCCECCVLSGTGLCDGLITWSEKS